MFLEKMGYRERRIKVLEYSMKITTSLSTLIVLEQEYERLKQQDGLSSGSNEKEPVQWQ